MAGSEEQGLWVGVSMDGPFDRTVVVSLGGTLDFASAPQLSSCLDELARSGRDMVVELRDLQFIDAAGLGVLAKARAVAEEQGRTVTLRRPGPRVATLLGHLATGPCFTIEP